MCISLEDLASFLLLLCIAGDFPIACARASCENIFSFFSADSSQSLSLACSLLSLLFVSLPLPFGEPPLRVWLEALSSLLYCLGESNSLLLFDPLLAYSLLLDVFLDIFVLLYRHMDIFLDKL